MCFERKRLLKYGEGTISIKRVLSQERVAKRVIDV
jgi:hypothetical protein